MLHRDCSVLRLTLIASVAFTETLVLLSLALMLTVVIAEVCLVFHRSFSVLTITPMPSSGFTEVWCAGTYTGIKHSVHRGFGMPSLVLTTAVVFTEL